MEEPNLPSEKVAAEARRRSGAEEGQVVAVPHTCIRSGSFTVPRAAFRPPTGSEVVVFAILDEQGKLGQTALLSAEVWTQRAAHGIHFLATSESYAFVLSRLRTRSLAPATTPKARQCTHALGDWETPYLRPVPPASLDEQQLPCALRQYLALLIDLVRIRRRFPAAVSHDSALPIDWQKAPLLRPCVAAALGRYPETVWRDPVERSRLASRLIAGTMLQGSEPQHDTSDRKAVILTVAEAVSEHALRLPLLRVWHEGEDLLTAYLCADAACRSCVRKLLGTANNMLQRLGMSDGSLAEGTELSPSGEWLIRARLAWLLPLSPRLRLAPAPDGDRLGMVAPLALLNSTLPRTVAEWCRHALFYECYASPAFPETLFDEEWRETGDDSLRELQALLVPELASSDPFPVSLAPETNAGSAQGSFSTYYSRLRKTRMEVATRYVPDIEDLALGRGGKSHRRCALPACMQAVVDHARTTGELKFHSRFVVATWLAQLGYEAAQASQLMFEAAPKDRRNAKRELEFEVTYRKTARTALATSEGSDSRPPPTISCRTVMTKYTDEACACPYARDVDTSQSDWERRARWRCTATLPRYVEQQWPPHVITHPLDYVLLSTDWADDDNNPLS